MEQGKDYYFDNGWLNKPPALKDEIKGLWKSEGALPEGIDPDARVEQVLYVVRRNTDQIVGLCSTFRQFSPRRGNHFYNYRTFIAPELRRSYVAKELLLQSRIFLEQYDKQQSEDKCLGILLEVEAEMLKYGGITVKRAVWKDTGFVYIGQARTGAHLRVYYFEDKLIEPPESPA